MAPHTSEQEEMYSRLKEAHEKGIHVPFDWAPSAETINQVAHYTVRALIPIIYGVIGAAMILVVFMSASSVEHKWLPFAAAIIIGGIYSLAIQRIIHPWMRKHFPDING